jgi:hypothetical protein
MPKPRPSMLAVGVGHNEQSSSHVWCTHGACRYNTPLRIVPDSGKLSENDVKPSSKQSCDVFNCHVSGSNLANDSSVLPPEARPFAAESHAGSVGPAKILTREAAADDIDGNKVGSSDMPHILMASGVGPVPCEHGATVFVLLNLPFDGTEAGAFQPQLQAADARKERSDGECHRCTVSPLSAWISASRGSDRSSSDGIRRGRPPLPIVT